MREERDVWEDSTQNPKPSSRNINVSVEVVAQVEFVVIWYEDVLCFGDDDTTELEDRKRQVVRRCIADVSTKG